MNTHKLAALSAPSRPSRIASVTLAAAFLVLGLLEVVSPAGFDASYGVPLDDPAGLLNSSLDGNVRRAIDIHEGDEIDEEALKDLIRAAVALNESKG